MLYSVGGLIKTLHDDLKLKIDDYGADKELQKLVSDYFWFLHDYIRRRGLGVFVHTWAFIWEVAMSKDENGRTAAEGDVQRLKVAKQNPGVDTDLLDKYRQTRRDLERLGHERKGGYRLAPALGGMVIKSIGRQSRG
jgi:hypothetical protein